MPDKPSEKEEEFIARKEYDRLKKIEEEKHRKIAAEEKEKLKQLHYMRCPKCGMELVAINYKNIEIDKCSECEGVWLDSGELEAVAKLETPAINKLFSVFRK